MLNVDQLWDSLRTVCCVTNPPSDAKRIVQLSRADVKKAIELIEVNRQTELEATYNAMQSAIK